MEFEFELFELERPELLFLFQGWLVSLALALHLAGRRSLPSFLFNSITLL